MVGGRNLCSFFLHRQPIVSELLLPSPTCDATSLTYQISICVVLILNCLLYFLGLFVPKNIIISTALVFLSLLFFGHAMQRGSVCRIFSSLTKDWTLGVWTSELEDGKEEGEMGRDEIGERVKLWRAFKACYEVQDFSREHEAAAWAEQGQDYICTVEIHSVIQKMDHGKKPKVEKPTGRLLP